jgi:DMSO/TMAO reductase YedYZ molybdopterin-dependent catalytic subunit
MALPPAAGDPGWEPPHAHQPNPAPPSDDATVVLRTPSGQEFNLTGDDLARLPQTRVTECMIASTGHPASGPFTFGGVRLADLLAAYGVERWTLADVVSGDGFGARLTRQETLTMTPPILLATSLDGTALRRAQGLVRLIIPNEAGDALRQVKWVARIEVR